MQQKGSSCEGFAVRFVYKLLKSNSEGRWDHDAPAGMLSVLGYIFFPLCLQFCPHSLVIVHEVSQSFALNQLKLT